MMPEDAHDNAKSQGQFTTGDQEWDALVELTESLAQRHDPHDILFFVASRLNRLLPVSQGSLILAEDGGTGRALVVKKTPPHETLGLHMDLATCPEYREVIDTARPLVIDGAQASPALTQLLSELDAPPPKEFVLLPVAGEAAPAAVLALQTSAPLSGQDLKRAQTVAGITAIALNNAKMLGGLKAQSRRERAERERRLAVLSRYFDVFESSADSMLVMQENGVILFANPSLMALLGHDTIDLVGRHFWSLFPAHAQDRAQRLVRRFAYGEFPLLVDFPIQNRAGMKRTVSISFSEIASEADAVLASMRDVTHERELARELAQTKEFFERVIESSVDGIVSADLKGNILLFNRAAARLFGYEKREVLGRLSVEKLYPEGVARELMRKIRAPEFGGVGRLEDFRVTMLKKDGEPIPATLSASFVMDGARPVATLGIFTDIREKLAMERRLTLAQEELREHEKNAAVAALAGAAAHELNQPLTSIMGYTEVLSRAVATDPVLGRAVSVIQTETERMAEIIRKVGAVTRVETKEYVGSAQIIDLERASEAE